MLSHMGFRIACGIEVFRGCYRSVLKIAGVYFSALAGSFKALWDCKAFFLRPFACL